MEARRFGPGGLERVGKWIETDDLSGWATSIRGLVDNHDRAADMGQRGRAYAEAKWNDDLYC